MGGVDLFDQQVSVYSIRIRFKKFWCSLFAWSLNAQTVNKWRLKESKEIHDSLLTFSKNLVVSVLKAYGTKKTQ